MKKKKTSKVWVDLAALRRHLGGCRQKTAVLPLLQPVEVLKAPDGYEYAQPKQREEAPQNAEKRREKSA